MTICMWPLFEYLKYNITPPSPNWKKIDEEMAEVGQANSSVLFLVFVLGVHGMQLL